MTSLVSVAKTLAKIIAFIILFFGGLIIAGIGILLNFNPATMLWPSIPLMLLGAVMMLAVLLHD